MFACPRRSETILTWTPAWSARVAWVCLRSWSRIFGCPDFLTALSKA